MPIRKRLSDPYSDDIAKFDRRLKHGAPPPAPPKPSLKQREAFVRSLLSVPIGQTIDRRKYFHTFSDRYMTERFEIWGQIVYILPLHKFLDSETIECTGACVGRHNLNSYGVKPRHRLTGEQRTWYSQVLHWIEDTVFDA